jgi:hypothetical protein
MRIPPKAPQLKVERVVPDAFGSTGSRDGRVGAVAPQSPSNPSGRRSLTRHAFTKRVTTENTEHTENEPGIAQEKTERTEPNRVNH